MIFLGIRAIIAKKPCVIFQGGGGPDRCPASGSAHDSQSNCKILFSIGMPRSVVLHQIAQLTSQEASNAYCGRPWPAAYITFMQITHQIQDLTEPLSRAQAISFAAEQREGNPNIMG